MKLGDVTQETEQPNLAASNQNTCQCITIYIYIFIFVRTLKCSKIEQIF